MATGRDNHYVKAGTVGLLFVEPQGLPSATPIVDDATLRMTAALRSAQKSDDAYRGVHTCKCGAVSDNVNHFVDGRFTTNSLAVHYLALHRAEVPAAELADVLTLPTVHANPTGREVFGR